MKNLDFDFFLNPNDEIRSTVEESIFYKVRGVMVFDLRHIEDALAGAILKGINNEEH